MGAGPSIELSDVPRTVGQGDPLKFTVVVRQGPGKSFEEVQAILYLWPKHGEVYHLVEVLRRHLPEVRQACERARSEDKRLQIELPTDELEVGREYMLVTLLHASDPNRGHPGRAFYRIFETLTGTSNHIYARHKIQCTKSRTQTLREENEDMERRLKDNEEKKKRQEEEQRLMEENASLKRKLAEVDEREGGSKAPKH
jgi:hypothetical protein